MIKIYQEWDKRHEVSLEYFKFPGGEMQVKVGGFTTFSPFTQLLIEAHLTSSDEIMALVMVTDAVKRRLREDGHSVPIALCMPYIPYARQDRVMQKGEALGIRAFCSLINSLGFSQVTVWDSHSDVALGLIDNVFNYGPESFVRLIAGFREDTVLVAPDAGAIKKVFNVAKLLGYDMVSASKHRDTKTGEITGTEVHSGHIGNRNFLIVDDICDGGATFVGYRKDGELIPGLAQVLRPLTNGRICLYVTHGIFSKGFDSFHGVIDHVYTASPWPGLIANHFLTILNTGVR
jgi:ribose-phosphate pyrophosphokinase